MRITEYRTKINQNSALTELVKECSVNYCTDDRGLTTPDAIVKMNGREIYLRAVLVGAVSIVLVHNHISGVSKPSEQDILITKKISDAGNLIGIRLMDHIIFGSANDYYSLKENGRFYTV